MEAQRVARGNSLRRLQYLRKGGGSLTEKLAAAVADGRSEELLGKLVMVSADTRLKTRGIEERLAWRREWDALRGSETELEASLRAWMGGHGSWGVGGDEDEGEEGGREVGYIAASTTLHDLEERTRAVSSETQAWRQCALHAVQEARTRLTAATRVKGSVELLRKRVAPLVEQARGACTPPTHWDLYPTLQHAEMECGMLGAPFWALAIGEGEASAEAHEGGEDEEEEEEEEEGSGEISAANTPTNEQGEKDSLNEEKVLGAANYKWRDKALALALGAGEYNWEARGRVERDLTLLHKSHMESLHLERVSWGELCQGWGVKDPKDPLGGWSHSAHCAYLQVVARPLQESSGGGGGGGGLPPSRAGGGGGSGGGGGGGVGMGIKTTGIFKASTLASLQARLARVKSGGEREQEEGEEEEEEEGNERDGMGKGPSHPRPPKAAGGGGEVSTLTFQFLSSLLASSQTSLLPTPPAPSPPHPPPTPTQVALHHQWFMGKSHHTRRVAGIKARYRRELGALLLQSSQALRAGVVGEAQAQGARQSREESASIAARSRRRLESERARAAVGEALARVIEAEVRAAEVAVAGAAAATRALAVARTKRLLQEYHGAVAVAEARVEAARVAAAGEEEERVRREREAGSERVGVRAEKTERRRAELAAEAAAAREEAEARREAALRKVLLSLPNREALEGIVRDPERALAPTASSALNSELARAYAAYLGSLGGGGGRGGDALVASVAWNEANTGGGGGKGGSLALAHLANARIAEQGLFARNGFTDKQVTGNKQFRLVTALRAEGLGGTKAVGRAFDALPPTGRGALMAMKSNARTMGADE